MEGGYGKRTEARKRPYLIVSYQVLPCGGVEVELPWSAPCADQGQQCCITKHSQRLRKTGIDHPLVVVRCTTHNACWTLYPPGFAPFWRRPIHATAGWAATLFAAALCAACGAAAWPRRQRIKAPSRPYWRTQTRHIQQAALLLGLLVADDRPAQLLSIPIDIAHKATAAFADAKGFRQRAKAIMTMLDEADSHDLERHLHWVAHAMGVRGVPFGVIGGVLTPL